MNKEVARLLKEISRYVRESEKELKRRWHKIPPKQRAKALEKMRRDLPFLRSKFAETIREVRTPARP